MDEFIEVVTDENSIKVYDGYIDECSLIAEIDVDGLIIISNTFTLTHNVIQYFYRKGKELGWYE